MDLAAEKSGRVCRVGVNGYRSGEVARSSLIASILSHVPGVRGVLAASSLPDMCLLCYVGVSHKVGPPLSYPFTLNWDFGLAFRHVNGSFSIVTT